MSPTLLTVLTWIFAVGAVAALYQPRFPAALVAYAALTCANFAHAPYITSGVLIFWAVATALVIGIRVLQPALSTVSNGNGYVATGAIAGTLLGYVMSPTAASMIVCSAAGAFFGAVAYMSTPKSPRLNVATSLFLSYLCAKGLPAVVCSVMAAIATMSLL